MGWVWAGLLIGGMQAAEPGWKLRLSSADDAASDAIEVSQLALRVDSGTPLSPFVPVGPGVVEWTGGIVVDLRGDFQFRAEGEGEFTLEIQGTNVLHRAVGAGATTDWSGFVRLRKGTNAVRAVLRRVHSEAVGVRVEWRGRTMSARPLAGDALRALGESSELDRDAVRRAGRDLYLALRCGSCHEPAGDGNESVHEAISLEGIASERRLGWLSAWVLDPASHRLGARMPRLLNGPDAASEAAAIAAFLEAGASTSGVGGVGGARDGDVAIGKALFDTLACDVCHGLGTAPVPAGGVGLGHVARKFAPAALVAFLKDPSARDPWTRMPRFALTDAEVNHLSAWLEAASASAAGAGDAPAKSSEAMIERGRRLVAERGCANCHRISGVGRTTARRLDGAEAGVWTRGCLGEAVASSNVPKFAWSSGQREALRAYLASVPASRRASGPVPWDDARRWVQELRCQACHGARDGVPALEGAGAKLRPEWTSRLLEGGVEYPSRPWLSVRMPAWKAHARWLSAGLAAMDGYAATSAPASAPDAEAAEVGRKLVSASGGFACVTCHPVGKAAATAVFEAPGIPFQFVADRLRPEFAGRWIRDPQSVDPTTKMPMYFDEEGRSPLVEYYGGDGEKTARALWEYLRLGAQMEPPQ